MPLWGSCCVGFHVALKHSLYSFDGLKKKKNRPNECIPVPPLKHTQTYMVPPPKLKLYNFSANITQSSTWLHTLQV